MSATPQPRFKFKSNQDWQSYIQRLQLAAQQAGNNALQVNFGALRQACFKDIEAERGRPLLVYASKLAANIPIPVPMPNNIDINDIDGFTDMINVIPADKKSIDVLLHSPGGRPDATERLVYLLRNRFDEVHFLIPHSAYSAATMLALSGDTITLHPSATLGPIDPQINGRPARSIKKGFEKVRDQLKTVGAASLPAYIPLLEKLSLELLEMCDDAETLSKDLVSSWLKSYMLKTEKYPNQIEEIVTFFSDYDSHKLHSRPLVLNKIEKFKLNISYSNLTLSELLWEAYILLENFFQMTPFVKIYENTFGISWGRQMQIQIQGGPQRPNPQPNQPPHADFNQGL